MPGIIIDTQGKIYDLLNQLLTGQTKADIERQQILLQLANLLKGEENIMADLATLQAAADAVKNSQQAEADAVQQLVQSEANLGTAVANIADFITNLKNQGVSVPDALIQELTDASASMNSGTQALGTASADLSTQIQKLADAAM